MFSPSSGSLNSAATRGLGAGPLEIVSRDGAAATAVPGCDDAGSTGGLRSTWAGGVCVGGCAVDRLASVAFAPDPFSTVKITWPTLTFSPSLTRISCTFPLTDDGTSTTALSVSSSITAWPSLTVAPGAIIRRTRSPCSMFSPSAGSLNSITDCCPYYSKLLITVELSSWLDSISLHRSRGHALPASPRRDRFSFPLPALPAWPAQCAWHPLRKSRATPLGSHCGRTHRFQATPVSPAPTSPETPAAPSCNPMPQ